MVHGLYSDFAEWVNEWISGGQLKEWLAPLKRFFKGTMKINCKKSQENYALEEGLFSLVFKKFLNTFIILKYLVVFLS